MLEEQNTPWGMKHRETALASTCGSTDVTVFPGNQSFPLRAVPIPSLFTLLPGRRGLRLKRHQQRQYSFSAHSHLSHTKNLLQGENVLGMWQGKRHFRNFMLGIFLSQLFVAVVMVAIGRSAHVHGRCHIQRAQATMPFYRPRETSRTPILTFQVSILLLLFAFFISYFISLHNGN